ncbi:hypothetical protein LTR93_011316, partial [Exophiala xenobiotica]
YIARLNLHVAQLKAEIARLEKPAGESGVTATVSASAELPSGTYTDGRLSSPYFMSVFKPVQPCTPFFIGAGSAADFALATIQRCPSFCHSTYENTLDSSAHISLTVNLDKVDRSVVSMTDIRELINKRYLPIAHTQYPCLGIQQLMVEMPLTRLLPLQRFKVLMAAAIGGAHAARNYPRTTLAVSVLRPWAESLLETILAEQNIQSFQALLLLIQYELVDPSHGLCWTLLGTACRLSVDLMWQRALEKEYDTDRTSREAMFFVLYGLEW